MADVRSAPYSRFRPHFNRDALAAALKTRGMDYVFLGHELGGRPDDPACYDGGRVDYERVAATCGFRDGIARIIDASSRYRIALMCAEKEPLDCHRTLLVARALDATGAAVEHILADGALEAHGRTMDRLLAAFDLNQGCDLFRRREELVADVIALQARRVAYVRRGASTTTAGGRSR